MAKAKERRVGGYLNSSDDQILKTDGGPRRGADWRIARWDVAGHRRATVSSASAGREIGSERRIRPLGKARDWRAVAGNHHQTTVTLKADGTIWKWEFPGDLITNPGSAVATKLGRHSDWVAISEGWDGVLTLARDGSLWLWRFENPYRSPGDRPWVRVSRRPQLIGNVFAASGQ